MPGCRLPRQAMSTLPLGHPPREQRLAAVVTGAGVVVVGFEGLVLFTMLQ